MTEVNFLVKKGLTVPKGSASTPSVIFDASDPNTGLYSPGADQVAVATNGTGRLFIDASGNVGIGTSSPGQKLDVNGEIVCSPNTAGKNTFQFTTQAADDASLIMRSNTTVKVNIQANGASYFDGGNVGIGTTSPSNLLHLSAAGTSYLQIQNTSAGNNFYVGNSTGTGIFELTGSNQFKFISNSSDRVVIDSSGRLLVGTSTARTNFYNTTYSSQFQVEGDSSATAQISLTSTFAGINGPNLIFGKHRSGSSGGNTIVQNNDELGVLAFMGSDGSEQVAGAYIQAFVDGTPGANDMPGRLVFSTTADGASSPTERMRINSSGNLMVGTASDQLNGIGAPAALTAFNNGSRFGANFGASTTGSQYAVVFSNPNGQIGGVNLDGTSTSYVTSSDYRLKENVVAVADGIARLQQLKPSRFNFIADPDKTVDGFLAHEVQSVVPEAINGVKDEVDADGNPVYQGIDQSKLVPLLTAALQEAIGRIETLEGMVAVNNITIDEQQHQLSTLAARLTALESA
jgi:hypothetical protein